MTPCKGAGVYADEWLASPAERQGPVARLVFKTGEVWQPQAG
jgi:hypothetical protein